MDPNPFSFCSFYFFFSYQHTLKSNWRSNLTDWQRKNPKEADLDLPKDSQNMHLTKLESGLFKCHHPQKSLSKNCNIVIKYHLNRSKQNLTILLKGFSNPILLDNILLMEEILQLIWYKYPIIYKVLPISSGAGFLPSTVCVQQPEQKQRKTKNNACWGLERSSHLYSEISLK